jgi:tetratricopeptide (TPR) repeat protein
MRDGAGPVALGTGGISRSLPVAGGAGTLEVPGGRLRVLMVISRPGGTNDVGYQMVARPLLQRLEAVRGEVELMVLRPPTFDALKETVRRAAEAGEPFHMVHFDGHGVMPSRATGGTAGGHQAALTGSGEGVLAFELPGWGSHHVRASRVAAALADGRVPVVVLNACQSGAMGKELEASVATALLRSGCAAVVAMAYSVYAVAAAEFMAAFYESLFAGDSVGQAVTAGRGRLFSHDGRPSPKGDMPLADWLVPVHYMRREVRFPDARTRRPAGLPSLDQALNEIDAAASEAEATQDPLAAVGAFVGRDDLFYQLEAAARQQRVVVLTGPGGTGKTELAKGFARWWRDTGGVDDPRLVLWHSFEPGVATFGLDGVITSAGLAVFGTDFARLEPPRRLEAVKKVLAQRRALLVWDNFESVAEMPDPAGVTPPLEEAGRKQLREFLDWTRDHSKSTVIITSRAQEAWLGQVRRISVGGLNRAEAAEYAGYLLAPFPAARPRRERRTFGELLEWLDGHPLAMRLTLPRLDAVDPADLLAGLRGTKPLPGGDDTGPGRLSSLGACITYSFTHLTAEAQRLLPAVSLLHGSAEENLLMFFSAFKDVPRRFADGEEWPVVLQDATRVGLLTDLGRGMYRIHPALPGYIASGWRADNPDGYDREREACEYALRAACAHYSRFLTEAIARGDAALAYRIIGLLRGNLGAMLGHALDHRAWDDAERIVRALDEYWDSRSLGGEASDWADRILAAIAGPGRDEGKAAGELWLYTTMRQANRQNDAGQPDKAEQVFLHALAYLKDQRATVWTRVNLSVVYHQLGVTAELRRRLDEADGWYRQAIEIREQFGLHALLATDYHQLGMTAQARGRLDEAEDWYRKALAIREELGDRPGMAASYHQLGWTALDRGRPAEAEGWYSKSLVISEELGNRPGMAMTYHELGITAQAQGRLDEAEDWYRKALTIEEEVRHRPGMAKTYGQLGLLADERHQQRQALEWLVRCVTLFGEFPHPATEPVPSHLTRLTRRLGLPALEQTWQQVTGQPLPQQIRDYVTSQPNDGGSQP